MNPSQQLPAQQAPADPRQQVLEQIKTSTNVLLTVSDSPSVDQLSAVIGMTLLLNKLGKHATAVFSGKVPSTIEFLQPEKTLEKTTDSLRDFIIALDKSKADKLRYKVEDKFVKIFITPYHTSLTEKDLEFSQGDFNVDLVMALGVKKRDELDKTIVEHGRILHDATVASINNTPGSDLGAIEWTQTDASGLSEMMVSLAENLETEQQKLLDQQIATCFLTGIVAQTDRFSNAKTSSQTMSLAAKLMNAGANQQLIATKLQPPVPIQQEPSKLAPAPTPPKPAAPTAPIHLPTTPPAGPPKPPIPTAIKTPEPAKPPEEKATQDGALLVPHEGVTGDSVAYDGEAEADISKIHIDNDGTIKRLAENEDGKSDDTPKPDDDLPKPPPVSPPTAPSDSGDAAKPPAASEVEHKMLTQPPPGNIPVEPAPEEDKPSTEAMNLPAVSQQTLSHNTTLGAADNPIKPPSAEDLAGKINDTDTLTDLERSVNSPHLKQQIGQAKSEQLPINLIGPDTGLPPDTTAGTPNPSAPPPVPPPLPISPSAAPGNLSNPSSGVPL